MKLMMYIGNDLIEAIPINAKDLKVPGYLGKFKRHLKVKYSNLLKTAGETVEFLVFNMDQNNQPPAINQAGQQH